MVTDPATVSRSSSSLFLLWQHIEWILLLPAARRRWQQQIRISALRIHIPAITCCFETPHPPALLFFMKTLRRIRAGISSLSASCRRRDPGSAPGSELRRIKHMNWFLRHLDRLLILGRVIAVFLSVAWRFAGGLSDRFGSLEHPSVFIHGLYGSFHKTFTPWFAMSLCVNN